MDEASVEINNLNVIIAKVKSIVTLFRRSNVLSNKLTDHQIRHGIPKHETLKLMHDVPTRWTAIVDMIERYLQVERYLALESFVIRKKKPKT